MILQVATGGTSGGRVGLRRGISRTRFLLVIGTLLLVAASRTQAFEESTGPSAERGTANRFLEDGRSLYRKGRFEEAVAAFGKASEAHPASLDAARGLVRALCRAGETTTALDAAQGRLRREPTASASWSLLGDALFAAARFEEAEQAYRGALDLAEDARAHLGLAHLHDSVANRKTARSHLNRAYELAPEDAEVLLEWALRVPKGDAARDALARWLETDSLATDFDREAVSRFLEVSEAHRDLPAPRATVPSDVLPLTIDLEPVGAAVDGPFAEYHVAVRLETGKRGWANLVLDTGSSGLLVSRDIARRLGAEEFSRARIRGVGGGGDTPIEVAAIRDARIAPAVIRNAVVGVLRERDVPYGSGGIAGTDVFGNHLIELDIGRRRIRLHRLPSREGVTEDTDWDDLDRIEPEDPSGSVAVRFLGHGLLVKTRLLGEHEVWMLLDTGAAQTALDLETAESLGEGRTSKTPYRVGGFGGEQEVRTLRSVTIQLGNARQEHFRVPAFSMKGLSGIGGYRVSGLLGTSFLRHVILWINYRDGWVRILPAERRSRRDRTN